MIELTLNQIECVAGGFNCLDPDAWHNVQQRAIRDAKVFTLFADGMLMFCTYGVASAFTTAAVAGGIAIGAGIVAAPYLAIYAYSTSNAWTVMG